MQNLKIPQTINFIGKGAFSVCNISSIAIPKSITNIPDEAFYLNYSKTISLPVGLEKIGGKAFFNNLCSSIKIPNTVRFIDKEAFEISNKELVEDNGHDLYDEIELPNPVIKEGYVFTHWVNEYGEIVEVIDDFKLSYSAQFAETDYYQVSGEVFIDEPDATFIDLNGDFEAVKFVHLDSSFNFNLNAGRTITLTPNKEGYVFQPESYVINDIQEGISNIYFYASRLDYDINFFTDENGLIKGESYQNILHGKKTTAVEAIPNSDCQFEGWFINEDSLFSIMNPLTITVTKDYNLVAKFTKTVDVLNYNQSTVIAYPNPVIKDIRIQTKYAINRVKVYNSLGNCILNNNINNLTNFKIEDLSKHTKGIVYIQLLGGAQQEIIKIIVE